MSSAKVWASCVSLFRGVVEQVSVVRVSHAEVSGKQRVGCQVCACEVCQMLTLPAQIADIPYRH